MKTSILKDKIKGSLYGFAIGDAMGATTEFMSKQQIKEVFPNGLRNIVGGGWLKLKSGEVTDDTQMTICIINAILSNKYPKSKDKLNKAIYKNFNLWLKSNPVDVGNQCYSAIINPSLAKNDIALGNGSLMRALPFALLNDVACNLMQSNLTHDNKCTHAVIQEYTGLINELINNKSYILILIKSLKMKLQDPTGHILNTFINSKYHVAKSNSFEEAIISAVNNGGDADTIAAITGSIAGALYGYKSIPKRFIKALNPETKMQLNEFADFVYSYKLKKGN